MRPLNYLSSQKGVQMLHIGHDAFLIKGKILAIVPWTSSPVKSFKKMAKNENVLLDLTFGKQTKSMILLNSGHVILSSLQPKTLKKRWMDFAKNENNVQENFPISS